MQSSPRCGIIRNAASQFTVVITILRIETLVYRIKSKWSLRWSSSSTIILFRVFSSTSVLYKQKTLESELIEVLDPNKLSADVTIVLQITAFSADGNFIAYSLSENGSDWVKIKIRDMRTGKDLPEVVTKVKFSSMSWTHDNKGLFYSVSKSILHLNQLTYATLIQGYPEQDGKTDGTETTASKNQKIYYHRVGESQDKDVLVADFPEYPWYRR